MANDNDPRNVQDELARMNNNNSSKKLAFDPLTGELVVKNSENDAKQSPNEVVVDQIYKDGFFTFKVI